MKSTMAKQAKNSPRSLVQPDAKGLELIPLEADERSVFERQYRFIALFAFIVLAVYVAQLWYLQVIKGPYYRIRSENNRIRTETIRSPRGIIFDRNGVPLVENRPAFHLMLVREDIKDPEALNQILQAVGELSGKSVSELTAVVEANKGKRRFEPIRLIADIDRDTLARVEARRLRLPGVYVEVEPRRGYKFSGTAAHLVGYLGEISEEELKKDAYRDYQSGEFIGKGGVEKSLEKFLRGQSGWRQVEVDALGRHIRSLQERLPIPGRDLWLTVDLDLQREAEECLKGKAGAIVAVDPGSGEILAMVSSPSFDQERFVRGMNAEEWKKFITDTTHPLLNRAVSSAYPPGSIYKPFVAVAALEEGMVAPTSIVSCPGFYAFAGRRYRCWRDTGHGAVDLHRAIVESCDVYFYTVGMKLGVDTIAHYAKMFGFGEASGIELPSERNGLIPTREWKLKATGIPWQKGETLSIAIGQGFDQVTPLQAAMAYAALVNGGTLWTPKLVTRIEAADDGDSDVVKPKVRRKIPVRKETLELVKRGLTGVVNEGRGTAHGIALKGVALGGKTGTAQVVRMGENVNRKAHQKSLAESERDHAWFVGYGPVEKPEIVVAVIVEHGGHGSSGAAPLAQKVMRKYLEKTHPELRSREGTGVQGSMEDTD